MLFALYRQISNTFFTYFSTNAVSHIMFLAILFVLAQYLILVSSESSNMNFAEEEGEYYTNSWVVRILGGPDEAKNVATQLGFDSVEEVSEGLPDFYVFFNFKHPEKSDHADEDITRKLRENLKIKWVEQQLALRLVPSIRFPSIPFSRAIKSFFSRDNSVELRTFENWVRESAEAAKKCLNLNDEYFPREYYIDCRNQNKEQQSHDLNVVPAWIKHGLSGKNVKVIVVDDGVETDHSDLVENYDPKLGLDLQDDDTEPDPVHYWWHTFSHGTRCAGVIGMKGNNSICGVGIAPSVTLGAVRLLGPKSASDYKIGKALLFKFSEVDIVSNSWALRDDGKSRWQAGQITLSALKAGSKQGRNGKGLIYVFACGTKKEIGENCARDPIRNSIYTITVASSDNRGKITSFSERCASIMVTTYSGDGLPSQSNVVATDVGDSCTVNHSGTSASAPMVSGAIALTLEANSNLTWRDVQHLLAWTSQVAPLQKNPPGTWIKNGAGFYVSHDFGFGMLDISELVEKAKDFQSVPPMNVCVVKTKLWKDDDQRFETSVAIEVESDGCKGSPSEVMYLEHVRLRLSLLYPRRGNLQIELVSPAGTVARLLEPRSFDTYAFGIPVWTFESVMTWGENPTGTWTVRIEGKSQSIVKPFIKSMAKSIWSTLLNATSAISETAYNVMAGSQYSINSTHPGELKELSLLFYGTKRQPKHYAAGSRPYHNFTLPT